MPQGDRTGPIGQGSKTGRVLGFCSGYYTPGYTKGFRGGMGRGFGFGKGRCMGYGRHRNFSSFFNGFFQGFHSTQTVSRNDEINLLKSQAETLKHSRKDIEKRLSELEKEKEKE